MKILIVEDHPKIGEYLKDGLAEAGFVADFVRGKEFASDRHVRETPGNSHDGGDQEVATVVGNGFAETAGGQRSAA